VIGFRGEAKGSSFMPSKSCKNESSFVKQTCSSCSNLSLSHFEQCCLLNQSSSLYWTPYLGIGDVGFAKTNENHNICDQLKTPPNRRYRKTFSESHARDAECLERGTCK
jgi:hypothetical protein